MYNRLLKYFFILFLTISLVKVEAITPVLTKKQKENPPPRIIRTCCSFGTDVGVAGIPLKKISDITSLNQIGKHVYLGDKFENNGIIYTRLGGFIDLGHLRDQADWTAFLYNLILENKGKGKITQKLGYEGGKKTLTIVIPENFENIDALLLAGKIAYDLSIWHEIATWFGTSYLPFIPERYSSFSIEDNYSNMLGVIIGMEAIKSNLSYEDAMTKLLKERLISLGATETVEETRAAMVSVEDIWWTNEKKLPSGKVLLERNLDISSTLKPWLIPSKANRIKPKELKLPICTNSGIALSELYKINFKLNHKFPLHTIFPVRTGRNITQKDFDLLMIYVKEDLIQRYGEKPNKIEQTLKKKRKQELKQIKKDSRAN